MCLINFLHSQKNTHITFYLFNTGCESFSKIRFNNHFHYARVMVGWCAKSFRFVEYSIFFFFLTFFFFSSSGRLWKLMMTIVAEKRFKRVQCVMRLFAISLFPAIRSKMMSVDFVVGWVWVWVCEHGIVYE